MKAGDDREGSINFIKEERDKGHLGVTVCTCTCVQCIIVPGVSYCSTVHTKRSVQNELKCMNVHVRVGLWSFEVKLGVADTYMHLVPGVSICSTVQTNQSVRNGCTRRSGPNWTLESS